MITNGNLTCLGESKYILNIGAEYLVVQIQLKMQKIYMKSKISARRFDILNWRKGSSAKARRRPKQNVNEILW